MDEQGGPAEVGGWDETTREEEVRMGSSMGPTGDRNQGRLRQRMCCRTGDETGGLELRK